MKSYLIKNKKYTFMIIFFICFFFCIGKVDALVYKGDSSISNVQSTFTGTITSGNQSVIHLEFSDTIPSNNYDMIAIKFARFNFTTNTNISFSNVGYSFNCTYWENTNNNPNDMECEKGGLSPYTNTSTSTLTEGSITINGYSYNSGWTNDDICYMSSEVEDTLLCPFKDKNSVDFVEIYLAQNGYSSMKYDITVSSLKLYFNNDTTEITNVLTQLGTNQINTTTTIQNFNNYVSDTSTTQAQTNQTTALGGMNSEFGSHLSQMNELTQLTMLPISFINSLLTNTCQPLVWDIPFVDSRVVVPCMSTIYNGYFSALVSTFSLVMTALLGYRAFIKLFNAIKGIIDAEDDKLEVVDL